MPIALRGPRKAMRGKCERGRGSANADGGSVNAGAEVQTRTGRVRKSSRAMGTRRRRLSAPWPRFHGADRPDVYIIIHVRACCCGECALNPPTAQPIPRRRPSLAPAQRHALPEHFRSPTQPRRTPAGCAMHARRPHNPFPVEDLLPPPHNDAPFPCPPATSPQPRRTPADPTIHSHRRPSPAHAQRHALPEPSCHVPAAPMHAHRPHNPFPAEDLLPPPHSDTLFPSPPATSPQPRRTPAGCAMHSPPKAVAPPRSADARPPPSQHIPRTTTRSPPHSDTPCLPLRSTSGTKKRHRTVDVRCRMSRSTVVAVGHLGW